MLRFLGCLLWLQPGFVLIALEAACVVTRRENREKGTSSMFLYAFGFGSRRAPLRDGASGMLLVGEEEGSVPKMTHAQVTHL